MSFRSRREARFFKTRFQEELVARLDQSVLEGRFVHGRFTLQSEVARGDGADVLVQRSACAGEG
jgi:hypothetical protein